MTIIADDLPRGVLLDTFFLLFLNFGAPLKTGLLEKIKAAGAADGVYVSPVSAWEIGLLSRKQSAALIFLPDPATWFATILAAPSIRAAPFNSEITMAATMLPDPLHKDPADRFLIATSLHRGVPIATRDRLILDYAAANHVDAIAC